MPKKKQNLSYEEALSKLENILALLEKGDLSLSDSIEEFSKGVELYKYCYDLLNKAEGKVKLILDNGDDNFEEVEFNTNS